MNSSAEPAENLAPDPPTPDTAALDAAAELKLQTPKTLPLKRDTPLFVPVVLPEAEAEAPVAQAPVAQAAPVAEPKPENNLPSVEFSPPAESPHRASVTLQLRCAVPGAEIRYALDADDVSADSQIYDAAKQIFLTKSTSIAARVFQNGQSGPLALGKFEIVQPGWQKLEPTDQSDPTTHEWSDQTALEGDWHLAGASLRGKLHAHRAGWREDAFRHGLAPAADGTYSVVVVSDGAGSAPLSRVGSNLLCQTAVDFLVEVLAKSEPLSPDSKLLVERDLPILRGYLVEAARLALEKLRAEAATRGKEIGEFASTLLILVRREWNNQQLCAALQAGDGAIALWNEDESLTLLGEADHGAQSGETRFITTRGMEAELPSRVKFSIRPHLRAVAVMSDGVADDYFPEAQRLPALFKTTLALVEVENPGAALLDWIDYEKKGSSDDRTLVICWRDELVVSAPIEAKNAGLVGAQAPISSEVGATETVSSKVNATETRATKTSATETSVTAAISSKARGEPTSAEARLGFS